MKINHILESRNYLYEGLDASSLHSVKLWESAGRKICEAELTADQITKLFAQVQQDATAAGSNRTMIGKGKDVATAVNTAWEDLKTKVQNSGPIKNIDAQYDTAAEKLKQATGGDAGVMKYVQKYRDFAKAHPIAQSLIYSALIAAAGISGAGLGGAAALGLFKMVDKLLQGEKFSSAAYAGAKVGAMAYGASLLKDLMSGTQGVTTSVDDPAWDELAQQGQQVSVNQTVSSAGGNDSLKEIIQVIVGPNDKGEYRVDLVRSLNGKETLKQFVTTTPPPSVAGAVVNESQYITGYVWKYSKSKLTESQIRRMFYVAGTLQDKLTEGVWDKVKGAASKAAGAVVNKAQTVGTNLTTKVTADKLMSAWKKAGSPTDSDAVAAIMKQAGVDDGIIASSMKAVGGQTTPTPVDPTKGPTATSGQQAKTGGAGAFDQMANQTAPADAEPAKPVDAQTQKFIQQLVASYTALTPEEKQQLKQELQDAVTASDVGSNVVKATNENKKLKKRTVR
jgi:hypothetical protein